VSNDAFTFARIAGGVGHAAGRRLSDNPHKRGSLLWHCWRVGHLRSVSRETIPRETDRGRAEWSEAERHLLARCIDGGMGLELAGEVVGRSYGATRIMASRMRRRAA